MTVRLLDDDGTTTHQVVFPNLRADSRIVMLAFNGLIEKLTLWEQVSKHLKLEEKTL